MVVAILGVKRGRRRTASVAPIDLVMLNVFGKSFGMPIRLCVLFEECLRTILDQVVKGVAYLDQFAEALWGCELLGLIRTVKMTA
jgi:hypothetical protein